MNDGGPAFPFTPSSVGIQPHEGMTLRDYFAGQALAGYCFVHPGHCLVESLGLTVDCHEFAAKWSYKMADAMIKEKEAKNGE